VKLVDISGTKRGNIRKLKLINLKLTVGLKMLVFFRDINDFKKCCQSIRKVAKDEKGDLVTDRLPPHFFFF